MRGVSQPFRDKTKGYIGYKNETLIDLLEITESDQAYLKTIISKDIKYARKNEKRKVICTRGEYLEQQKGQLEEYN